MRVVGKSKTESAHRRLHVQLCGTVSSVPRRTSNLASYAANAWASVCLLNPAGSTARPLAKLSLSFSGEDRPKSVLEPEVCSRCTRVYLQDMIIVHEFLWSALQTATARKLMRHASFACHTYKRGLENKKSQMARLPYKHRIFPRVVQRSDKVISFSYTPYATPCIGYNSSCFPRALTEII